MEEKNIFHENPVEVRSFDGIFIGMYHPYKSPNKYERHVFYFWKILGKIALLLCIEGIFFIRLVINDS
jgi:hypothetical protein